MAERIGFVGLGIMGKPMARNLMAAGYELTVYDIVGEPVEELATEGATAASSPSPSGTLPIISPVAGLWTSKLPTRPE